MQRSRPIQMRKTTAPAAGASQLTRPSNSIRWSVKYVLTPNKKSLLVRDHPLPWVWVWWRGSASSSQKNEVACAKEYNYPQRRSSALRLQVVELVNRGL